MAYRQTDRVARRLAARHAAILAAAGGAAAEGGMAAVQIAPVAERAGSLPPDRGQGLGRARRDRLAPRAAGTTRVFTVH